MVVERREAQRARSRRFAQAERSVARATPEARAGGNIRPRGVAHDPAPPGAPLFFEWLCVTLALAKLGREQNAPREWMRLSLCLFVDFTGGTACR